MRSSDHFYRSAAPRRYSRLVLTDNRTPIDVVMQYCSPDAKRSCATGLLLQPRQWISNLLILPSPLTVTTDHVSVHSTAQRQELKGLSASLHSLWQEQARIVVAPTLGILLEL